MDSRLERPCLGCQPCSDALPVVLSTSPPFQVPASMAQYLRDYQRNGVRFLYQRYQAGGGGILADDMGLGKTIQAIAFMAAILKMTGTKLDELRHVTNFIRQDVAPDFVVPCFNPVLIICPASLVDNWKQEIITWGYFKVLKFISCDRSEIIDKAKNKSCDVVIATFEAVRCHVDLINSVLWSAVIVDEVHRIKDVNSQTTKVLCSIQDKHRFGLTGTPIQNNLKELWCILNWANPNSIEPFPKFSNLVIKKIELGERQNATKREVIDSLKAFVRLEGIKNQYMLRRTKDLLAKHLPAKTDQVLFCELSPAQENIYRALVQSPDVQMLLKQMNSSNNDCNSSTWKTTRSAIQPLKSRASHLLTYLNLLQKAANHPSLLISSTATASSDIAYDICLNVLGNSDLIEGADCKKKLIKALSAVEMSGKMQVLLQLSEAFLKRGDKILIFSYSTKLLDLIEREVKQRRFKFSRLDGSTPTDTRFDLVQAFNASLQPSIFLISTKAGGVGLNITGANVVIIYDPNWNPAHDLQAQDRAYRLGQRRDVRVYRLLSTATIEEFIYLRQLYKQQLGSKTIGKGHGRRYFNSVPGDRRYYGELFGIKNIFSFRQNKRSLTEEILERQESIESNLKFKLPRPETDEICGAKVQPFHVESEAIKSCGTKSGFTELCEEITGLPGESVESNSDSDIENDGAESEEMEDMQTDQNNEHFEDSVTNILEMTTAVQNIVEHDEITAPSRAEEFMTDCAIRDVLQKQKNSQLPAFVCSSDSQDDSFSNDPKEGHSLSSACKKEIIRFRFYSFAKQKHIKPYDLAVTVLSMSPIERLNLLNTLQKRKLSALPTPNISRPTATNPQQDPHLMPEASQSSCSGLQSNDESTNQSQDLLTSRKRRCSLRHFKQHALYHGISKIASDDSEVPIQVSKNTSSDVKDSMDSTSLHKEKQPDRRELLACVPHVSACKSGFLSEESSAILDALFLSDHESKPSPKKKKRTMSSELSNSALNENCTDTSSVCEEENSRESMEKLFHSVLFAPETLPSLCNEGDNLSDSDRKEPESVSSSSCVKDLMNEMFFNGSREKEDSPIILEKSESEEYNLEDDIFRKLLKSGKLKFV